MRWLSSLLAITLTGLAAPPRAERSACTIEVTPFRPIGASTYLLAVASTDTVVAGPGTVEHAAQPGHWGGPDADSIVLGQRFGVERYGGAATGVLDSVFAASGARDIVVVLWDYDATCRPTEWPRSAQWTFPGASVYLSAELRDLALWVENRPTFDSFFAGEMVYPFDALTVSVDFYAHLDTVGLPYRRRTDRLNAEEVFTLIDELPKPCRWVDDPAGAAAALRGVQERHAGLRAHFPASAILRQHERWAREAVQPQANRSLRGVCDGDP